MVAGSRLKRLTCIEDVVVAGSWLERLTCNGTVFSCGVARSEADLLRDIFCFLLLGCFEFLETSRSKVACGTVQGDGLAITLGCCETVRGSGLATTLGCCETVQSGGRPAITLGCETVQSGGGLAMTLGRFSRVTSCGQGGVPDGMSPGTWEACCSTGPARQTVSRGTCSPNCLVARSPSCLVARSPNCLVARSPNCLTWPAQRNSLYSRVTRCA